MTDKTDKTPSPSAMQRLRHSVLARMAAVAGLAAGIVATAQAPSSAATSERVMTNVGMPLRDPGVTPLCSTEWEPLQNDMRQEQMTLCQPVNPPGQYVMGLSWWNFNSGLVSGSYYVGKDATQKLHTFMDDHEGMIEGGMKVSDAVNGAVCAAAGGGPAGLAACSVAAAIFTGVSYGAFKDAVNAAAERNSCVKVTIYDGKSFGGAAATVGLPIPSATEPDNRYCLA
jgi:hypothetical protein